MKKVNLGLIGIGNIGSGVISVLKKKAALLKSKLGIHIVLKTVSDIRSSARRHVAGKNIRFTTNALEIINDPDVDVVIELMGGIHPAKEYILKSLEMRKYVVTANKALLAEEGDEIFNAAKKMGVDIYFEGSVGGGIPIIRSLREGLIANQVQNIYGIINGTSNYILTKMAESGCSFKKALIDAQKMGYAERNPKLDINGVDTAHKTAILSRICFAQKIKFKDVYVEGINNIDARDIQYAAELGFCIKLLAIAKKSADSLDIRVHPTLLPKAHLLSNVQGVYNAVFINADLIGQALLYGEGAGKLPTASAVVSDVLSIAEKIGQADSFKYRNAPKQPRRKIRSINELRTRYYFRFSALDKPAVLSKISDILGRLNISIHSVIQKGRRQSLSVPIVMMTHEAKEKSIRKALSEIDKQPFIKKRTVAIRIERI